MAKEAAKVKAHEFQEEHEEDVQDHEGLGDPEHVGGA
jgi:hypothetical protein